jgi:hypothetical protein
MNTRTGQNQEFLAMNPNPLIFPAKSQIYRVAIPKIVTMVVPRDMKKKTRTKSK